MAPTLRKLLMKQNVVDTREQVKAEGPEIPNGA